MNDTITLWTIQDAAAAEALRGGQILEREASVEHVLQNFHKGAVLAYWWMWHEVQRRTRCDSFRGVFWAWKSPTSAVAAADPHMQVLPLRGEALIRLAIPSEKVVLSRFSLWEIALVGAPIFTDEEQSNMPEDPSEVPLAVILSTWDKIFDLDFEWPYGTPRPADPIQAAFTEIRPEWVIEIVDHKEARRP